jgi:uncharacterized protein (DUF1778 family)
MPVSTSDTKRPKSERLEARITNAHKELLQEAAAFEGRSVSEFVTRTALEAARRLVRERRALELSDEDTHRFVKALLKPPKPNAKLRRAVERYRKMTPR